MERVIQRTAFSVHVETKWRRKMESICTYQWSIDSVSTPLVCLRFRSSDLTLTRLIFFRFSALMKRTGKYVFYSKPARFPLMNGWLRRDWVQICKLEVSGIFRSSPFIEISQLVNNDKFRASACKFVIRWSKLDWLEAWNIAHAAKTSSLQLPRICN